MQNSLESINNPNNGLKLMSSKQIAERTGKDHGHEEIKPVDFISDLLNELNLKASDVFLKTNVGQKTYIAHDKTNDLYKIGKSKNIKQRQRTLKCSNPYLTIILILDFNIESSLHKEFSEFRFEGEWFSLSKDQILYLKETHGFKPLK